MEDIGIYVDPAQLSSYFWKVSFSSSCENSDSETIEDCESDFPTMMSTVKIEN